MYRCQHGPTPLYFADEHYHVADVESRPPQQLRSASTINVTGCSKYSALQLVQYTTLVTAPFILQLLKCETAFHSSWRYHRHLQFYVLFLLGALHWVFEFGEEVHRVMHLPYNISCEYMILDSDLDHQTRRRLSFRYRSTRQLVIIYFQSRRHESGTVCHLSSRCLHRCQYSSDTSVALHTLVLCCWILNKHKSRQTCAYYWFYWWPTRDIFLFQRLSGAIQRFNAVCFTNSFGNIDVEVRRSQPRHT